MAGNSKRTLTLDLRVDLDSKEAERNIESLGKEFLSLMSKMNKSGKGMNVFKDLVSYISRLDSEMTTFRREHADDFNRIFGDIDTTLLNQMQTIFGVTKEQLTEINALRDKIAAARKKPNTSVDEIKSMEKEVRDLYAAIGKSGESGISGRGKIETRFDRLEESLNNFARTWESVNDRVSKGFGSGSGGAGGELEGFSKEVQQEIDKIQNEIEELKKVKKQYEDTVKDLKSAKDNKGLVNEKKYGPETSVEGVQKLMDEYTALQQKIQSGSKDSVEYYQNLNRLAEVAIKLSNSKKTIGLDDNLKKQFEDISADNKNYPNKYVELLSYQSDKLNSVRNTVGKADIKNIDNFIKAKQEEIEVVKQANNVQNSNSLQNEKSAQSYDKLSSAMQKAYNSTKKSVAKDATVEDFDKSIDDQDDLNSLIDNIAKTKEAAKEAKQYLDDIWSNFDVDSAPSFNKVFSELCNVLGVDIPKSAQKTEDALKSVDRAASSTDSMTNDGLDKINEQPSKPDSKDVADINKVEGALEDVGSQAKEAFNAIGKGADKAKPSVDKLSQSLQRAFTDATNLQLDVLDGKTQGKETMNLVDSNGIVSSVQGDNYIVDGKVLVGQMISNLKDNIVMSLHDHPNAIDAFTPADVEMFAKQYYGQGIKLNGIIANGIIKTIDFNGMSQDVAMNISQSYFDNLSQAAKEYSELFSFDNGNLIPTPAVEKLAQTDPDKYQEINDSLVDLANASLEDAFKQNGVEPIIKEFTKSQIPQLSEYINTIQNSAQSALTPVEKLQNLITSLNPNKTIDWNKYNDDLIKFANNEVDAISTFNKISNDLKSGANVKEVAAKEKLDSDIQDNNAPKIEAEADAHRDNANAIKEEAAAKDKLDSTIQGDDAADDIARENGKLEEKLELLREIADAYGSNITNAKRNRYEDLNQKDINDGLTSREEDRFSELGDEIEEAESNLKEFGATYDKITLKFAKGKDKDILPDDKGLRDLYKYADSMAYDEFNGKEIEDVIFTRKQEQAIIEQTNQGLQEQARIQERVAKEQKAASGIQMDDSRAEVEKTISSYEELCSVVERYNQLVLKSVTEGAKLTKQEDKELSDIQSRIAQTKTGGDPDKMVDHAINWGYLTDSIVGRVTNTDALAKYLGIEIPQAAEKAKQAIKEVDNTNVDPKVDLSMKNELQEIEKQAEKTDSALEELDRQKVSVNTKKDNKADVKATSSDGASLKEYQQLEMLDAKLKEVKAAIEAKTQAFREEGSTVDSVVVSEAAALEKLSSKLDEIVTKIKLVGDSFNQINSGSVDQVEGAIEAKQEKTQATTSGVDTTSGKWALDSTLSTTNSILQGILTAVSGSESASQMAAALNGAINELKAAAEAIKINANDFKDKSKNNAKDTSNDTKEKTFDEIKSDEISSFEKYKKAVESSIYVTDEFKSKLGELHSNLSNVKDAEGLKSWKESFSGFQKEFDRFESANQKVLTGQVNAIKNEAKAAMKGLDLDTLSSDPEKRAKQEEIAQGFKEIQIASEICASKIKSNQNAEIDALNATKKQLLENINAYRQQYGLLNGGKSGKNFGNTAVMQETTRYNKFQQYAKDEAAGYKDSATFNKALAQYTSAYERLIALRNRISAQSVRTDKDEQEFNDAKRAAAEYGKELDKLLSRSKRLEQNSYASSAIGGDINTEDASDRKQALTDFIVGMQGANESTMRFSKNYEECTFKMKNGDGTWTKMTATLDKTSNKMYATAGEVTKYGTAIGEFGAALKGEFLKLGRYMIASFGIEEVIQVVRQGITYVKEIDDALTDLKKVTNETDAGYARFLQTMSKTAGVVGSTVAELTTMAAEWARLNI